MGSQSPSYFFSMVLSVYCSVETQALELCINISQMLLVDYKKSKPIFFEMGSLNLTFKSPLIETGAVNKGMLGPV